MEYTQISGTELRVSRIALGTWAIGGWMWGGTDEEMSIRAIHAAMEKGMNLIDTAPVYGFGRSEEIVGRALSEGDYRQRAFISTKTGLDWKDGRVFRDSSPAFIRRNVRDSLRRLRTDYIDILFVHWPDPLVPFEETAGVLYELFQEGTVRAVGVSNYSPEQIREFRRGGPVHVCQPPYNLFERGIEGDLMPFCRETGLSLMAYGALCRGMLSGKMSRDREFKGDDLRKMDPKFQEPRFSQYLEAVERLQGLARERFGKGVLPLALRWVLEHGADIALWGARSPGQLDPVAEALGWHLDQGTMREIDGILEEIIKDPVGPGFMGPPGRERQ
jgi:aryl-alcohol dehydrogenase-like predicted oxidoreductase